MTLVPVSVNFHFTRRCNYQCGFCFHTAKTSHLTPVNVAKECLRQLRDLGMMKLNMSGGEPFLYPKYVGEIARFCKEDLKMKSVSVVSNGSKIRENFFQKYGKYLDILAVSCDSFDEQTNIEIGRGKGEHLDHLEYVASWCRDYNIKFKLNTVVNRYNVHEDMNDSIERLQPFRWKVFQVLAVDTENSGDKSLRDISRFTISDEEFESFCERHHHQTAFVKESNQLMKSSYLILDEYMRFLNKGDSYREGPSIVEVGAREALRGVDFERDVFYKRGGVYDWRKVPDGCSLEEDQSLKW